MSDFCQKSWEYPQIFSDFDQKIWNFREKNPDFFRIFSQKKSKFSRKNLRFFWIFCQKNGGTPKNLRKIATKSGGTRSWKNGHPRGALGTTKVKKMAFLDVHLVRRERPRNKGGVEPPLTGQSYSRSKKIIVYSYNFRQNSCGFNVVIKLNFF